MTDDVLAAIGAYVSGGPPASDEAFATARLALLDALGCALLTLRAAPEARRVLGPVVPGTIVPNGARVPGTDLVLDPVQAAHDTTALIRWLDFNDTWLAAEWGHPSDSLGAILAAADHASRARQTAIPALKGQSTDGPGATLLMRDVLAAQIRAYEIQGVLALTNALNRHGIDHTLLVEVAATAAVTGLLGGDADAVMWAASLAFADGGPLRAYRHAPDAGPRKSWAAADATGRAVWLATLALRGEPGYPHVLTTPGWGFADARLGGQPLTLAQPLGSYVMEHILFKIAYPAEFHAQTAAEAAIALHPQVAGRLDQIARIELTTQESAYRIIVKSGPLRDYADRDHCLQYIVAAGLLFGTLDAATYSDAVAADPRLDMLRDRMIVAVDAGYSRDYLDPARRSIANAVQVVFADGTATERVAVDYPLGHRRRRAEGAPLLRAKLTRNLATILRPDRVQAILDLDQARLEAMPVPAFLDLWTI